MGLGKAIWSLFALTALYLSAIFILDQRHHTFDDPGGMLAIVAAVVPFSFLSYLLRYARWNWLLQRRGHRAPVIEGFASYVAGFAFTASPGKIGELVRIRYFARMNIPADRIFSTFIVERLFDLLTLGLMSIPLASSAAGYDVGLLLIGVAFMAVMALSRYSGLLYPIVKWLRRSGWIATARGVRSLSCGLREARHLLKPTEIVVSLALGIVAWSVVSLGFVVLLNLFSHPLPWMQAVVIPPAAMLIGAASMLPGGVGATETLITLLLNQAGISMDIAAAAAIGFRIATLWFAIIVGLVAIFGLETVEVRKVARLKN